MTGVEPPTSGVGSDLSAKSPKTNLFVAARLSRAQSIKEARSFCKVGKWRHSKLKKKLSCVASLKDSKFNDFGFVQSFLYRKNADYFFKWDIPSPFFFIFVFSIQLIVNNVQYKLCRRTGFKLQICGVGSDHFTT